MYKPLFNQVLIEVDTEGDKWGTGNEDSILEKDYREGVLVEGGWFTATKDYPFENIEDLADTIKTLFGKRVMWNKGHEAGKTFEHDGKLYAFVYWFDLVAVDEQ